MEKVAEHINEMQRIHEEYGAIFDHLFRQHQKSCKQVKLSILVKYKKEYIALYANIRRILFIHLIVYPKFAQNLKIWLTTLNQLVQ